MTLKIPGQLEDITFSPIRPDVKLGTILPQPKKKTTMQLMIA